ncbi:MAG: FAD-binding oxidoreductase, partial [Pseudomonadota bacterium]
AVVGAGIAGASAAAELARDRKVVLLEQEDAPGRHTTGRSAALFSTTYGPPAIRALSRASQAFYEDPEPGFAEHPLLTPRGTLFVAREGQGEAMERLEAELAEEGGIERLTPDAAVAALPILRREGLLGALLEVDARGIDVELLHRGYLRAFAALGGALLTDAGAAAIACDGDVWRIETPQGEVRAETLVNAAGAWADVVAERAGAAPRGLVPKRRTAMIVPAPDGVDPMPWRMAVGVEEDWYLKPEGGKLLISPADETPSRPCDAQPEELDVALAVERVQAACRLEIRHVERKWAGLRSFFADKSPACGWDPERDGFFWLAGQGGYGIQSAPALGRVAASLVRGEGVPADCEDQGVTEAALSPARLPAGAADLAALEAEAAETMAAMLERLGEETA